MPMIPTIAILSGGFSCEREISLMSGKAVKKALDSLSYNAIEIDVDKLLKSLKKLIRALLLCLMDLMVKWLSRFEILGCVHGKNPTFVLENLYGLHPRFQCSYGSGHASSCSPYDIGIYIHPPPTVPGIPTRNSSPLICCSSKGQALSSTSYPKLARLPILLSNMQILPNLLSYSLDTAHIICNIIGCCNGQYP
ncbi:d-alanine--D-alanine ligase [Nephila pilipes]|uniref:D-alanine--D-alanine ligase n=1 Tax=Nephila pilipes TaxID=299642 RepID=A0A8X6PBC8_NEPPI|nr:d-alanine--D-alanine ligase [Nephila pilipes]